MKIISVNTGKSQTIEWKGRQVETGIFKYPAGNSVFLGTEDVDNDQVMDRKYHGGKDKACYLYSAGHYEFWKKRYPDVEMIWGMFGENLTVEGLDESQIHIGDVYQIGGSIVQVTQPRQPCFKLGFRFGSQKISADFVQSGYSGIYVRVLQTGSVSVNDTLKAVYLRNEATVRQVFELLYSTEPNPGLYEKIVSLEFIAESCKKDLIKRWGKEI